MERPKYPDLTPYDRITLSLWVRSHAQWRRAPHRDCLAEAAVVAVLAGLRRCARPEALFDAYDSGARLGADFALIGSLFPALAIPDDELLWRLRETAFYLRWVELTSGPGSSCESGGR